MGVLSTGLIAEYFLQILEDTHLTRLFDKHKITTHFCFVDDVLIIYEPCHMDIKNLQNDFNTLHPKKRFTAEAESDNRINFLDITIQKIPTSWVTSI
jgi:hypothetical protein